MLNYALLKLVPFVCWTEVRTRPATSAVALFARLALRVEPVSDNGLFAQSMPPPRAIPEDTDSCPPVLLGWPST
jgi:hypothetical protein